MSAKNLLVDLTTLSPTSPGMALALAGNIAVGRPDNVEEAMEFITRNFSRRWADQFRISSMFCPSRCFIARHKTDGVVGFSGYDASGLGLFGPLGVSEKCRGLGIGRTLTLMALHDMKSVGYRYAVIWQAGRRPLPFYLKFLKCKEV